MSRRPPRQARFLGLWTAGWLALLLLLGLLVAGDIAVQWPVFAVPVLWALVALRPRRGQGAGRRADPVHDDRDDEPGFWDDDPGAGPTQPRPRRGDPVPPTRETQVLPPLPPSPEDRYRR